MVGCSLKDFSCILVVPYDCDGCDAVQNEFTSVHYMFKMGFYRIENSVVTESIVLLRSNNQVLCNTLEYDFRTWCYVTE